MSRHERFRKFFENENISQKDFAKKLDSTQQYVSALLNGRRKIGSNIIDRLEKEFDMNIAWFVSGEGSMLKGETSKSATAIATEPGENYENAKIDQFKNEIRSDLSELAKGITKNFEVLSEGMFESLKGQQKMLKGQDKLIDFIDKINSEEITIATNKLNEFLEEQTK